MARLIAPVTASSYVLLADAPAPNLAYLLANMRQDSRTTLVVINGKQEEPALGFLSRMYGTGQVVLQCAPPAPSMDIDYDYQLAATG